MELVLDTLITGDNTLQKKQLTLEIPDGRSEQYESLLVRSKWSAETLDRLLPDVMRMHQRFLSDGEIELRFEADGSLVVVKYQTRLSIEAVCSRCGKNFETATAHKGSLGLHKADVHTGALSVDELDTLVVDDNKVLLSELLQECIIEGTEEFPLCKQECQGLCARCGTDLNEHKCQCAPETNGPLAKALQGISLKAE